MPKTVDLLGRRFGRLTVVEKTAETHDRYRLWRCRCDCGGEILADTRRLQRGSVRSCGCDQKPKKPKPAIPTENGTLLLTGQRFGRLTALRPTERRGRNGSIYWLCRCDCGRETEVTADRLLYGNCKSCGCLQAEQRSQIAARLHLVDDTCLEWLEKRKHRTDNTSGFRGVALRKNGRYYVSIGLQKKRFYIGSFDTFAEAVQARLAAEQELHEGFLAAYAAWEAKKEADPDWAAEHPFHFSVQKTDGALSIKTNAQ